MRALAVALAVLAPGLAAAQTPTEVLAKVDATYASAKAVSAKFTQTVVNTNPQSLPTCRIVNVAAPAASAPAASAPAPAKTSPPTPAPKN